MKGRLVALAMALLLGQAGADESLVEVAHPRELRGVWIASVNNLQFPSRPGLSVAEQQRELTFMLDRLQAAHFNAVFFQVRPEGDALYEPGYEPWSRFLTGTQGEDPGYDPLAFTIQEAHRRNLEVHAWLNPYRAQATTPQRLPNASPHLAADEPEQVYAYGKMLWMDPARDEVRERLVDVCRDLAGRYDLDGLHFDDYFYPYPEGGQDFPDDPSWKDYEGPLSRGDWRRANVNRAIQEVSEALREEKPYLRFGISPFGIPAPAKPPGITGLDQYDKLYADTQLWMDRGWVDYLAPQLYWPSTQAPQAYEPLLTWWTEHARDGRAIFPGYNLAAWGSADKWSPEEYRKEFELTRARCRGQICWNIRPLLDERRAQAEKLFAEVYPTAVLSPQLAHAAHPPAAPRLTRVPPEKGRTRLEWEEGEAPLRAFAVYARVGDAWRLDRLVPAETRELELSPGNWAVTAVDRQGLESGGASWHEP